MQPLSCCPTRGADEGNKVGMPCVEIIVFQIHAETAREGSASTADAREDTFFSNRSGGEVSPRFVSGLLHIQMHSLEDVRQPQHV